MYACKTGKDLNVEYLLKNEEIAIKNKDKHTMSAQLYAAENGHLNCIKKLKEIGNINLDIPGKNKMTMLHFAAIKK